MAIIRVQKTENYSIISNEHLRNMDLSLKAKGLMTLMLSLPPNWDYSIGGLVAICKESHTSIRSAVKELEQNRYLVRERKNNEKGYFIYEYTLYETQQPHIQKQHTVKKNAEDKHTENRTQISKDKKNKEKINKEVISKDIYKDILREQIEDIELIDLYEDYIEMRKSIDAPLNAKGLEKLIERNNRLSKNNIRVQKVILETAIINSWKNIYAPKEEEVQGIHKDATAELKNFYGLEN